jgi:methionine-rich copper-binding protein CopC
MFRMLSSKAKLLPVTAAFAALALAGAAEAHAHLLASTPAANASGPAPSQIDLKFSEAPLAKFSGIAVSDATGGSVPAMPMKGADAKTLTFMPTAPLKPGVYSVKWHAVTADTHRTQGAFTFTVR